MKRKTSLTLAANSDSKTLFQELPDEALEQISGGDGTCAACTVKYLDPREESKNTNQSSIAMHSIGIDYK